MRVLVAIALVLALSGCLNDFDEDVLRNRLSIQAIDISAPEVRSGAITFHIDTILYNQMSRSGDLHLEVKAFDTATNLLVETAEADVEPMGVDKTRVVSTSMVLPRESGYRIQVTVIQDEQIVVNREVTMSNLQALAPNVRETGVGVTSIDFFIDNATGSRVAITASLYVTNEGTGPSSPLRAQVKAREITTGIVADEAWIDISSLPEEETHKHDARMEVPDGYNYAIEAVLWDGQFIVGRHDGAVQLLPTLEVPNDTTIQVNRPSLGDFARNGGDGDSGDDTNGARAPGLGLLAAIAAIGGIAWMKRRK